MSERPGWDRHETAWGQVWWRHVSGALVTRRFGDWRYVATMPGITGDYGFRWTRRAAMRLVESYADSVGTLVAGSRETPPNVSEPG